MSVNQMCWMMPVRAVSTRVRVLPGAMVRQGCPLRPAPRLLAAVPARPFSPLTFSGLNWKFSPSLSWYAFVSIIGLSCFLGAAFGRVLYRFAVTETTGQYGTGRAPLATADLAGTFGLLPGRERQRQTRRGSDKERTGRGSGWQRCECISRLFRHLQAAKGCKRPDGGRPELLEAATAAETTCHAAEKHKGHSAEDAWSCKQDHGTRPYNECDACISSPTGETKRLRTCRRDLQRFTDGFEGVWDSGSCLVESPEFGKMRTIAGGGRQRAVHPGNVG